MEAENEQDTDRHYRDHLPFDHLQRSSRMEIKMNTRIRPPLRNLDLHLLICLQSLFAQFLPPLSLFLSLSHHHHPMVQQQSVFLSSASFCSVPLSILFSPTIS